MLKPFIFIYCIVIIFPITYTADYCKICKNKSHTMCKYKTGPADACAKYKSNKMSPKIRHLIERFHNELRNKVASGKETRGNPGPQPPASNMMIMKWDEELSKIAQRWADQCRSVTEVNQHDECKDTERFKVGQNVMKIIEGTKAINFEKLVIDIIQNWYNESRRMNPKQTAKFIGADDPSDEVGHYAQIVWATTKYVGCAHSSFVENITQHGATAEKTVGTFICNYGPTGNIVGASMYKEGKPCTECKCTEKYSALCEDTDKSTPALDRAETKTKREAKIETNTEAKTESTAEAKTERQTERLQPKPSTKATKETSGTENILPKSSSEVTEQTSKTESILPKSSSEATKETSETETTLPKSSSEVTKETSETEQACTPHTSDPHRYHHHGKGEWCPFESLRTRIRLLHRDGDECYCLFRIGDSSRKFSPEFCLLYLFCLLLHYFIVYNILY